MEELKKLQRNQLKSNNKDEVTEAVLSTGGSIVEVSAPLEDSLLSIATELAALRQFIMTSKKTAERLSDMQLKLDKQGEVVMKQQLFLEQLFLKERETNMVVLGVPDEERALEGAIRVEDILSNIWHVIGANTTIRSHRWLGQSK